MAQAVPFRERVRMPRLPSQLEWLNTAGPLSVEQLRGKFVLLDFWTYCCINCMHQLPHLDKLERTYARELVVIGVHTGKFDAEKESERILEAIRRYGVRHPVINDRDRILWNLFGVRAWPTLILIDPEGYVVWGNSGETPFEVLDKLLRDTIPYYEGRGLLDRTPLAFGLALREERSSALYYPGKLTIDEHSGRLFIADSGHHRVVVAGLDGRVIETIGSGTPGLRDGAYEEAQFNDPQGLAVYGNYLYVADTKNHAIRKIDLSAKRVITIAGTGQQLTQPIPTRSTSPSQQRLASPWDLCVVGNFLYIAMAGTHQIWRMSLDETSIDLFAGNGREDIVDGPLRPVRPFQPGYSSFAQPSGLATDGMWLYVADSEGSSIRAVPLDRKGQVRTVVGTAHLPYGRLFTFGDVDGSATTARFQHPLDVAFWDGVLYVADTYNNKIRKVDPKTGATETFVGGPRPGFSDDPPLFFEPAGLSVAQGKLFVADTNNHAIRIVDLRSKKVETLVLTGLSPVQVRPVVESEEIAARRVYRLEQRFLRAATNGKLSARIFLPIPAGWKLNPLAPITCELADLLAPKDNGEKASKGRARREFSIPKRQIPLEVDLPLERPTGELLLEITVNYFICTEGQEGLCRIESATWLVPVELRSSAGREPIELAPLP